MKYANLFYFRQLNNIGGVESWLFYLSKMFKQYDLTVTYKSGDVGQLLRLEQNIRCVQWDGKQTFSCKKLFVNYNTEILDYVKADEVIYMIHSDYESLIKSGQMKSSFPQALAEETRINRYVAVSQLTRDAFYRVTGIQPEVCYNPLVLDPSKKVIRLCSAQRMTKEKGKLRIEQLLMSLEKYCHLNDTDFQWDIFTKADPSLNSNRVHFRHPDLEVNRLVEQYDYFVALSDNEGYCYSVVEALARGVPCVVTPCPVFKELGLNDTNSITLEFDCSNVYEVVEKMFDLHLKGFQYQAPACNLERFLALEETSYQPPVIKTANIAEVTVQCMRPYFDVQLNKRIPLTSTYQVSWKRALELYKKKLVKIL